MASKLFATRRSVLPLIKLWYLLTICLWSIWISRNIDYGKASLPGLELSRQNTANLGTRSKSTEPNLSDVTIAIQATFHACAEKILLSIHRFIPGAQFIVACEELPTEASLRPNVTWVRSPKDAGLAQGRNILLDLVKTDFVLLLDEDFIFEEDPSDGVLYLLKMMKLDHFDLIGGCLANSTCSGYTISRQPYRLEITRDSHLTEPKVFSVRPTDMVDNFFIARSMALRRVKWDSFLKVGEHEDFFLRAYKILRIGTSGALFAHHDGSCRPSSSLATYNTARSRVFAYWKFVFQKWKITALKTPATTYQLLCDIGDPRFAENLDHCHIDFDARLNPWGPVAYVSDPFPSFYVRKLLPNATVNPKIGIVTVATGNYQKYIETFLRTMRKYFLPGMDRRFYIFTDGELPMEDNADTTIIYQKTLGWPFDSLLRFEMVRVQLASFDVDYLYLVDIDVEAVNAIDQRILSPLVGAINAFYWGRTIDTYPYDRFPWSPAYVGKHEGRYYFAGGFFGGEKEAVAKMLNYCSNMSSSMLNGRQYSYVSPWHDESIVNFYFNKVAMPTLIAGPEFLYPEPPTDSWLGQRIEYYNNASGIKPLMYNLGVRKARADKNVRQFGLSATTEHSRRSSVDAPAGIKVPFSCDVFEPLNDGKSGLCAHFLPGSFTVEEASTQCQRLGMTICSILEYEQLNRFGYCSGCSPVHASSSRREPGWAAHFQKCSYCFGSNQRSWQNDNAVKMAVTCCKEIYLSQFGL